VNTKARILFVDDEKRVLNAMRGLFRREYELFLTTEGSEAIRIAAENNIDVIVADQRMPGMTGIEVLGKVKALSPRTVRILLTGYADPSAVEGSINIGEVFRFLSKPCTPGLLRETLGLAINASRTEPVTGASPAANRPPAAPEKQITASASPAPLPTPTQTPSSVRARPPAPAVHGRGDAEGATTIPAANPPPPELPVLPVVRPVEPAAPPTEKAQPLPPARDSTQLPDIPVLQAAVSAEADESETELLSDEDTQPALPVLNLDHVKAGEQESSSHWQSVTHVIMSEDTVEETQKNKVLSEPTQSVRDVGVVVFTVDPTFAEMAIRALSADRITILATTLVKVAQAIEHHQAGVLVTDFTTNSAVLQKMIGALKQHMPELVTIVVSSGRDTTDMINLINYGQVFRYVLKPIEPRDLRNDINAAAIRYLYLVNNPDSVQRHQVMESPPPAANEESSTLNRFLGRLRKIQSERSVAPDIAAK
jgi:response regulator RpfG family c-di-GMP phosphodiesterase